MKLPLAQNLRASVFSLALVGATFWSVVPGQAAPYIDDFSTTDNLTPFGSVSVEVASNTLTATRATGGIDSGFEWNPGGSGSGTYFSLLAPDNQFIFSLDATAPVNGGYYKIDALFWTAAGDYVDQVTLQVDTNATGQFSYDVAAAAVGFPTAAQWSAQIRIQPFESDDVGFQFQNFEAVPEPSTVALLTVAGLVVLVGRRRVD